MNTEWIQKNTEVPYSIRAVGQSDGPVRKEAVPAESPAAVNAAPGTASGQEDGSPPVHPNRYQGEMIAAFAFMRVAGITLLLCGLLCGSTDVGRVAIRIAIGLWLLAYVVEFIIVWCDSKEDDRRKKKRKEMHEKQNGMKPYTKEWGEIETWFRKDRFRELKDEDYD